MSAHSSAAVIRLAEAHDGLFAAVGIQPNYAAEAAPGDWDRVVELIAHPRVVAVGETGLDLGSGGGFDVFIAARRVGPTGRAIGVDMTPEMVSKARRNAEQLRAASGLDNVEFRLGEIEHLPVADASVDCVISNCVINLSPDKAQVWREIARVLKPGGRVAVSDLGLVRELPDAVRASVEALIGCIAGAVLVEETERLAREAGLTEVKVEKQPIYSDNPADWADTTYASAVELLPEGTGPSDFVVSMDVSARKPRAR